MLESEGAPGGTPVAVDSADCGSGACGEACKEAKEAKTVPSVSTAKACAPVSVNTTGSKFVVLNVCGVPVQTSSRTLTALPGTFFCSLLESALAGEADESTNVELTIDLDFAMEAVHVLLTVLRAARSSINLAFRAVQQGLASRSVEVTLLFDYVGLAWLIPTHVPSQFDSATMCSSVVFEYFDFSTSMLVKDVSGILRLLHLGVAAAAAQPPVFAIIDKLSERLEVLDVRELAAHHERAFACGKLIHMPVVSNRSLVLDFGSGHALAPTGVVLWMQSPPRTSMLQIVVSGRSEITGQVDTLVRSEMHESQPYHHEYVMCQLPITPSLRNLYRMFCFEFEFHDGDEKGLSLVEVELYGDYVTGLAPEVLTQQPPRFHFKEEHAAYREGLFAPALFQMTNV